MLSARTAGSERENRESSDRDRTHSRCLHQLAWDPTHPLRLPECELRPLHHADPLRSSRSISHRSAAAPDIRPDSHRIARETAGRFNGPIHSLSRCCSQLLSVGDRRLSLEQHSCALRRNGAAASGHIILNSCQTGSALLWCQFLHLLDTADWLDAISTAVLLSRDSEVRS